MGRPKTIGVEDLKETVLIKALKDETEDAIFQLSEDAYLKRLKGTTQVSLHKDGKELDLEKAKVSDLDFLYVSEFFETVENQDRLEIDKSLFYSNEKISKLTRSETLALVDKVTYTHCEGCPITLKKGAEISFASYCSLSCPVGVELQVLGAVFENHGRCRAPRGNRGTGTRGKVGGATAFKQAPTKKEILEATAKVKNTRDSIELRRFKALKIAYIKLVNPKQKK